MAKKIYETTAFGTVTYSAVQKPVKVEDGPKGERPDEYQLRIELSPEDLAAWQVKMKKHAESFTFKTPKPKLGISVNQETGKITLMGKSRFKPVIVDAKNNKIDEARIAAGSVVRMNVNVFPYDKGLSLALSGVQVKKLVEYSEGGGTSFDTLEDGYESEGGSGFAPIENTTAADVDALGI